MAAPSPKRARPFPDVVQFSSAAYYCEEGQGEILVDVVRLGPSTGKASLRWFTRDGSAKAGHKFVNAEGELEFAPGETRKSLCVQITENETFDAQLEFEIVLRHPKGAQLGLYLYKCRVIITDTDTFPTNRFQEALQKCDLSAIPRWSLMLEYFKMNLRVQSLRRKFLVSALGDQLLNLRFAYSVFLLNYLIDNVLNAPEPPKDADTIMWIIAGMFLVPHVLLLLNDILKAERRIRGMAIDQLQANLMRKFLNYDEASRHTVSTSDIVMAITRDVPELVDDAFLSLLSLCMHSGRLLVLVVLMVYNSPGFLKVGVTLSKFLGFPLLMFLFLRLRHPRTEHMRRLVFQTQTDIVGFVQQTTDCFRLISDYKQRPAVVSAFSGKVKEYNAAAKDLMVVEKVNSHFAPSLATVVLTIFVLTTYREVLDGQLPLGEFITGMGVWQGIGQCYEAIYEALLQMQRATAPLHNIVFYMNLPVDACERLRLSNELLQEAKLRESEEWQALHAPPMEEERGSGAGKAYVQDSLNFQCEGLSFSYPVFTASGGLQILDRVCFEIPQGSLVAVTGCRASGKASLLKLLGGVLLPSGESSRGGPSLFVPPHLRVLHVSQQVQFLNDLDVFENICFGPSDGADEAPERVLTICKRLGISQEVLQMIKENVKRPEAVPIDELTNLHSETSCAQPVSPMGSRWPEGRKHRGTPRSVAKRRQADLQAHWSTVLSHTDRCLIHIARALVMNPEVLVVHQPLANFDEGHRKLVMGLLREFVDQRGIEKPAEGREARRPRTCIFSASNTESSELVDRVLHINQKKVEAVDMEALGVLRRCARELFSALDLDKDSRVTLHEFVEVVMRTPWISQLLGISEDQLHGSPHEVHTTLSMVFNLLDYSGSGDVDCQELVQFLRRRLDDDLSRVLCALQRQQEADELEHMDSLDMAPERVPEKTSPARPAFMSSQGANSASMSQTPAAAGQAGWSEPKVPQEEVSLEMPPQEPRLRTTRD